jgi:hypothetical protein
MRCDRSQKFSSASLFKIFHDILKKTIKFWVAEAVTKKIFGVIRFEYWVS